MATHTTGPSRAVEQKIGHAKASPNGDNDRPYGKCYGQVNGVSYPCTQRMPEEERKQAVSKAVYEKAKRVAHNAKKVRCVETGEVFRSMRDAADSIGVSYDTFRNCMNSSADGEAFGKHYEVVG